MSKLTYNARNLNSDVTVRRVSDVDTPQLLRLAALDTAEDFAGPALVAEIDGKAVAALPLDNGGRPIADPFTRTEAVVQMLELRAAQMERTSVAARRLRRRLRLTRRG